LPVSFRRIRIAGFKSFAEPVSVDILPGLTGIVGPNGCGKSNVVEALRWAMGESSARNLRGGEMDDVIFAGTAGRPSRNAAEVALYLDETAGVAPPPFHEQPDLEIIRRIERGSGSNYKVNGKDARARDVQTLFADLASGARASAMVSQGRVGALVGAKPTDRRAVLEEAAGITGLHARRHEAELKLRGAEANLARAEDLRAQLESQLGGLKRQARQASRYRNLSGMIRDAEAELLSIQRAAVEAARTQAHAAVQAAGDAVGHAAEAATAASVRAAEAAAALPPLREAEADARTALERHRVAQEQVADEETRARGALADAARRHAQLRQDLAHAEQMQRDSVAAEEQLMAEDAVLTEAGEGHEGKVKAAEAATAIAADAVRLAEHEANRATEAAAEANARAQSAAQMLAQAEQRARRLNEQFARINDERDRVSAQQVDPAVLARAAQDVARDEATMAEARAALDRAEQARPIATAALAMARDAQSTAETARARLAAEAQALAEVLSVKDGERWPPIVDSLQVPAGLEAALGAGLGEELTSALDPEAARHWRELPPLEPVPSWPDGIVPLGTLVRGPPAMARALSHIGLVEDDVDCTAIHAALTSGQILVSRAGAIWRWDGHTVRAGTPSPAAVRLRQRNRLADLRGRLAAAEGEAEAARKARTEADAAVQAAAIADSQARTARREIEQRLERGRGTLGAMRSQAATAVARLAAADDQLARMIAERDEADTALVRAREVHAALPDIAALRSAVERSRALLTAARTNEAAARLDRDSLVREHATRTNRRRVIAAERAGWADRAAGAAERVNDLSARRAEAETEHAMLEAAPARIAARRAEALDALQSAEATHRHAASALATAVNIAAEADKADRAAEMRLGSAREDAVRAEAAARQADHAWGTVAERILEKLGARPELPEPPAELNEDKARRKVERLTREREEMGAVNLRAEAEAEEVEKQVATIELERRELTSAIAKLRGSIGHLNREGRERLTTVFHQVDANFQQLFSRMFGGGRAHLALVGSDDPLEAGLEIYAQPPGKKLATLSLLSGGEQALTALSLIFAVFRCNPAPVCVLDEVDAPLDDANVERFCLLLQDMVRETETRFMVVTHHPLTMARMDRLYGVTMQERGVSRLLSVDLVVAAAMVEPGASQSRRAAAE
jgi:chromosome segregation protein